MRCPVCSTQLNAEQTSCAKCGLDLKAYIQICYAPDALYNEAVELIDSGDPAHACEKLAAAHAQRPSDAGILKLWSAALASTGETGLALEKAVMAMELQDDTELQRRVAEWSVELDMAAHTLVSYPALREMIRHAVQSQPAISPAVLAHIESVVRSALAEHDARIHVMVKGAVREAIIEAAAPADKRIPPAQKRPAGYGFFRRVFAGRGETPSQSV